MDNIENESKIHLIDIHGEKLTIDVREEEKEEDLKGDENIEEVISAIKSLNILFKMSSWKNAFEWSKDNISTALIWISGIGAIIQIRELASIHVSYIRFFSVTQLISDGALVLLMAAFITIIAFITTKFLTPTLVAKQLMIDIKKNRSFGYFEKYGRYFCMFLGSIACVGAFMEIRATDIQKNMFISMILISFIFAYLTYSAFYYSVFDDYLQKTNDRFMLFGKYNFKNYYTSFNRFMVITTAMVICIVILKSIFLFPSASRLPYNLENYNKVAEKVEKDYKDINQYKLLYFSDTYAFIEIRKNENTEGRIVVYKTDDLMF